MPKARNAIALFFITTEKSGKVLEPENMFYLFPETIHACFEEATGRQHFLLRLVFGRPYADVEQFMVELMRVYPLLIQTYTIFESKKYHDVTSKARWFAERAFAATWDLAAQCKGSEFDRPETFFAWIMTKVLKLSIHSIYCFASLLIHVVPGPHFRRRHMEREEEAGGTQEAEEGFRRMETSQPSTSRSGWRIILEQTVKELPCFC